MVTLHYATFPAKHLCRGIHLYLQAVLAHITWYHYITLIDSCYGTI